jgi:hypothetical protein
MKLTDRETLIYVAGLLKAESRDPARLVNIIEEVVKKQLEPQTSMVTKILTDTLLAKGDICWGPVTCCSGTNRNNDIFPTGCSIGTGKSTYVPTVTNYKGPDGKMYRGVKAYPDEVWWGETLKASG